MPNTPEKGSWQAPLRKGFTAWDNNTDTPYNSTFDSTINGKTVATPEPSSLLLLGAGLVGLALLTKFRS